MKNFRGRVETRGASGSSSQLEPLAKDKPRSSFNGRGNVRTSTKRQSLYWIIGICCLCLATFSVAIAQSTTGAITGRIIDSTGAVIVGAKITATNRGTNISSTVTSDGVGNYTIVNLQPGVYQVTATMSGFEAVEVPIATLVIDQKLLLNFQMKPGSAVITTIVTGEPPMLQTQTSETGTVMETQDILDLPLQGRQFFDLTSLVPGVVSGGNAVSKFSLSVNGTRSYGNSVQVDGIESTDNRQSDVTVTPSVDAVQEFKVSTSAYSAEFGHSAGGVVSIQTKAGSNQFHGVAYEFFRPNFTAARQYAFGATSQPSTLKQHNYGGTLGGPIRKNKSFFFVSFEGLKMENAYTYLASTPPISQIKFLPDGSADLSGMIDPFGGKRIPIFDPNVSAACYGGCAQEFPNDVIPAGRVSQAGKNVLLNFFPKPNLPGTNNGWFRNFAVDSPVHNNGRNADARFDQKFSDADQLFAVYHYGDTDYFVADPFNGATPVAGAGDADQATKQYSQSQEVSINETHVFSPNTLNVFRFGLIRTTQQQYSLLNGRDLSDKYGVGNITVPGFPATVGFPYIYMGSGYLTGGSTYKPFLMKEQNFEVSDSIPTSHFEKHDLKFGGTFRRLNSYPNFSLFPTGFQYYGSYGYSLTSDPTYSTIIPGAGMWAGGSDIADLLLGLPANVAIGLQLTNPHTQSWELAFYGQDTFRVTPKLTLNYGLRYEYQNPYTEAHDYQSNFDPASGSILLANRGGNSRALMQARKDNFGPRFGFAYQLNSKTVWRGGWGMFFSPENDGREEFLTKNVPFATQSKYGNSLYNGLPFAYNLDVGVPRSTQIQYPQSGGSLNPATIPNGNLLTTYYVDPKLKTGYSQLFNMALERQLSSSLTVELDYVGSLSHNLSYEIGDINAAIDSNGQPVENRVTPYLGTIQALGAYGWGKFNSMQVKVTKRASRNLRFLASYTYGHSLDNGPAPFDLGHTANNYPQNPYDLHAETGSSDFDVRHNFIFSGLYRLPVGRGQAFFSNWGPKTDMLLGGWQINSIYIMRTGLPINVVRNYTPIAAYPGLRPNLVGNPNLPKSKRTLDHWFNTDAFSTDGLGEFQPGNAGRNIFKGPGYINLDFSLFKEFAVDQRFRLQTRLETFNTFNTPHFSNPDGNMSDGTFGSIQYTDGNPRVVQLAAKFIF